MCDHLVQRFVYANGFFFTIPRPQFFYDTCEFLEFFTIPFFTILRSFLFFYDTFCVLSRNIRNFLIKRVYDTKCFVDFFTIPIFYDTYFYRYLTLRYFAGIVKKRGVS